MILKHLLQNNANTLLSAVLTQLEDIFLYAIATLRAIIGNPKARQVKHFRDGFCAEAKCGCRKVRRNWD